MDDDFKYITIYKELLEQIQSGVYDDGKRLPTEEEIEKKYGVSRVTCRKAYKLLLDENVIARTPRKGTFVNKRLESKKAEQGKPIRFKKTKKMIALVMPNITESYGTGLINSIEEKLREYDAYLVVCMTYGIQSEEEKIIDELVNMNIDGIILNPVEGENYNSMIFKMVVGCFPFILLDRYLTGIPAPCISTNNIAASEKLCEYLMDMNHTNICLVAANERESTTIEQRITGFENAYLKRGLQVQKNIWYTEKETYLNYKTGGMDGDAPFRKDFKAFSRFILENPQITAFFALEYSLAELTVGAVDLLGKKIPEDFSLVCFDGVYEVMKEAGITHIKQREKELGIGAVELLMNEIVAYDNINRNTKVYVDVDLITGGSVKINNKK